MTDRLMLECPEKMCEYCCNFDKEHIGIDGMALCKLTMTLAYAEDHSGNCMFYNVPKEQIIVPPCKVGDTVYYFANECDGCEEREYYCHRDCKKPKGFTRVNSAVIKRFIICGNQFDAMSDEENTSTYSHIFYFRNFGKTVYLTKEEAERALKERVGK